MSDFGTMIIVCRRDGADVDDEDRATLDRALAPLRGAEDYSDTMGEAMQFRIGDASLEINARGFSVVLSEYWLEGDELEFDPDELLAEDEPAARAALDALRPALEAGYELELVVGHW